MTTLPTPTPPIANNHQAEAVKTYTEQTKVLISLASAFVVAPAAAVAVVKSLDRSLFVASEIAFVASVFCGYLVFSSIAGNQHEGRYDVYAISTRVCSWLQIICFAAGLGLFVWMVNGIPEDPAPQSPTGDQGTSADNSPTQRGDDIRNDAP